tara:strand:- start:76 stop:498 length:423 start_codon:yes stop_codon:yes gene_type:complete
MTFKPLTEAELAEAAVLPAGEYDFEVIESVETLSKNGNNMLALKIKVFHDGSSRIIRDWLVESDHAACITKLRHYCVSVGALDAYESGSLAKFPGKGAAGKVKIKIERSEEYGTQNRVSDYVKGNDAKASKTQGPDDIPF